MKLATLGACLAAVCGANPIQYIFVGTGTGSVGTTNFTAAPFTITFSTDTTALVTGISCCANDTSTPSDTANTFTIDGISGSFTGIPAVFLNPVEMDLGIWFFAEPDFLPTANPAFATYNFTSSVGPLAVQAFGNLQFTPPAPGMPSTAGAVSFSAISDATFQAIASAGTVSAAPEPGTLLMFGAGMLGMAIGIRRRQK